MAYAPAVHKNRFNILNLRESVRMVENRVVLHGSGRQFESCRPSTEMILEFIENGRGFF